MRNVGIDDLEPGMILAEDLKSDNGRLLLPAGSTITAVHLRTCRIWGITSAEIMDEGPKQPKSLKALSPAVFETCKAVAEHRFQLNKKTHPAVREMIKVFILRHATGMSDEQAKADLAELEEIRTHDIPKFQQMGVQPNDIVRQEMELGALPDIFYQISKAIKNPRSSAAFIAEVVSKDVVVSAKLLKMVNTPFYGFPSRIDTLSRAVAIIGTNQLASLALGISVIGAFDSIPEKTFSLRGFWIHSILCGIIARLIAAHKGIRKDERFFVAGLLHDIGRLVVMKNNPEAAQLTLNPDLLQFRHLLDAEQATWGTNHEEIGGKMLAAWRLPPFLADIAAHHHSPMLADMKKEASIVHVADFMAHSLDIGASGSMLVSKLDLNAWDMIDLTRKELSAIASRAERQTHEIMHAFFGD